MLRDIRVRERVGTYAVVSAGLDAVAVPLDADRLEVYRVARELDVFASRVQMLTRLAQRMQA